MTNSMKEYKIDPKLFDKLNNILDQIISLDKARKKIQTDIEKNAKDYLKAEKPLDEDLIKHWSKNYDGKLPAELLVSIAHQNMEQIFGKEKADIIKQIKFTSQIGEKPSGKS